MTSSPDYTGRRVYLINHRLHHGLTGCILCGVGIYLAYHDRKDWRRWARDFWKELNELEVS